jgi:hypothetical protein
MRGLLAGYAGAFNRRHHRAGHLFQNRYKSIVVEEEPYLLELVRYLHLNPLRAGIVRNLRALDRYPWSGHAALVGRRPAPWLDTRTIWGRFGHTRRRAQAAYRAFVAAGVAHGRRPDLQGGGLLRSLGGWAAVRSLKRGRERWAADERILGSSPFVEATQRAAAALEHARPRAEARTGLATLLVHTATTWGLTRAELSSGSRRRGVAHARAVVSHLAVRELGLPIAEVARALGVSPTAVRVGLGRGETLLAAHGIDPNQLLPPRREVR